MVDPIITIKPTEGQMQDVYQTVLDQRKRNERTLVLTTTKRLAEEVSSHLTSKGIKAAFIHSEHKTFDRNEILRRLRLGTYEVVIGINLLREGIDLPEVSKVLVLDAGGTGFARDARSLIQITGRAARNANGEAVFYTDEITSNIQKCLDDNKMKREIQLAYNKEHNIVPKTIIKAIPERITVNGGAIKFDELTIIKSQRSKHANDGKTMTLKDTIEDLRKQMEQAAKERNFEKAIELRDLILELEGDNEK
ncbi:helicase-related protein [Mycoplasma nasistruthionis]|uniref:helicase-related protein n=1 Tax=Mycoplasma nasistruthionis TaxID=353852 RepID=UPI0030840F07